MSFFKSITRGLAWVGDKMGAIVTPIILAFFYFTVIAAASLVALAARADMLHRKTVGKSSFWFEKPPEPKTPERYLAQY